MSNITRHNYETFFLLYADNELSATEKNSVNEFVQANPDLHVELRLLQQSILQPGDIIFEDKFSLLRHDLLAPELQEQLLLNMDGELDANQKAATGALINANAEIKKEWEILQQTKLAADNKIVFPDKSSLYKKEPGRVVAINWRSVAVAALLIGFGIWGATVYFNGAAKTGDISTAKNTGKKINNNIPAPANTATPNLHLSENAVPPAKKETIAAEILTRQSLKQNVTTASATPKAPLKKTNREMATIVETIKDNNLPKPNLENLNNDGSNKTVTAYVKPFKQPIEPTGTGQNEIAQNDNKKGEDNVFAVTTASYIDNSEESNNRILFMDEEKIKKTKLGGIFRKVKRVLERSANIKAGNNNIKVANLEFSIQ